MVAQYPDSIVVKIPDSYSQDIETGNYGKTAKGSTVTFDCRAEAGQPGRKGGEDGVEPDYAWMVYAELIEGLSIPLGSEYVLTRRGSTFTGWVKGFMPNQFNMTLWL